MSKIMNKTKPAHPLRNPLDLAIRTPMMDKIIEHIEEVLFDYDSGTCLLGTHRIGKSTAMQLIAEFLNSRSDRPAYCHYFSADKLEKNTIKQMYEIFCYQENIETKINAKGLALRELIIFRLLDRLILSGADQILLLIDELQRLNTSQLDALASLHDIFRRLDVNLCIVFVGNTAPSLKLIEVTEDPNNRLIYGRFFENQKEIFGIRSKAELRKCLSEFDRLRYPEDGPTYTQYFVRDEAPADWKLASLTDLMWDVYKKDFASRITDKHRSWGMKYFISTVRTLLTFYLSSHWTDDRDALRIMISECITRSRIVPERVRIAA